MDAAAIHARRWWTLAVMCLSLMVIGVDNTILNVALPTLVRDLDASTSQLRWILDAYTLVSAGLLLTVGSLLASTYASSLGTGVPEAARALAAKSAFVDGMHVGVVVAAGVALFGSIVALAFLPSRAREEAEVEVPAAVEVAAA